MLAIVAALAALPLAAGGLYDGWKPLRYCNDPGRMEAVRIPPLTESQAASLASLEQVQVIARHGARAPYTRVFCWENEEHNPMTAEWKCESTSVSSQDIGTNTSSKGFGRLYRKNYLHGGNILHGDCMIGGLLAVGRQQHLKNGELLRDAYIGEGPLKLFPTANLSELPLDRVYLRSDDEERTLGSGHALLDGFFPPDGLLSRDTHDMLTWNVADYKADYIAPNEPMCPKLTSIWSESLQSEEYKKRISDPARTELTKRFESHVGKFSWDTALECLATSRCNNLALPDGVDEELFDKVFQEVEAEEGISLVYSDAWYSKVAMQPLANDVISRVDKVTEEVSWATKLAITMGHDSTLMPLLAALLGEKWDRTWTPYAGMLVIEVYRTKKETVAARIIFHGEALRIPGCDDTLCDIVHIFDAFEFSRTVRDCTSSPPSPTTASSIVATGKESTTASVSFRSPSLSASVAILLVGIVLAVGVFLGMRRRRHRRQGRQPVPATPGAASSNDNDEESLL